MSDKIFYIMFALYPFSLTNIVISITFDIEKIWQLGLGKLGSEYILPPPPCNNETMQSFVRQSCYKKILNSFN